MGAGPWEDVAVDGAPYVSGGTENFQDFGAAIKEGELGSRKREHYG